MQPVQDCLCRAALFQGFVVTSNLDAYHISLLLKCIIVKNNYMEGSGSATIK